jgi:hypothetical protein
MMAILDDPSRNPAAAPLFGKQIVATVDLGTSEVACATVRVIFGNTDAQPPSVVCLREQMDQRGRFTASRTTLRLFGWLAALDGGRGRSADAVALAPPRPVGPTGPPHPYGPQRPGAASPQAHLTAKSTPEGVA